MVIVKRSLGQVSYNDGDFTEVQLVGIGGVEEDLLLGMIQIHRCDTENSRDESQRSLPVGRWLEILTTNEIRFSSGNEQGR
jgi:hypothetical protein